MWLRFISLHFVLFCFILFYFALMSFVTYSSLFPSLPLPLSPPLSLPFLYLSHRCAKEWRQQLWWRASVNYLQSRNASGPTSQRRSTLTEYHSKNTIDLIFTVITFVFLLVTKLRLFLWFWCYPQIFFFRIFKCCNWFS